MRAIFGITLALLAAAIAGTANAGPPQRVVSVNLCTDEYVFRLIPRDRIAALSFLAGDRNPVVSTIVDEVSGIPAVRGAAEEVLAHRPDLVVMDQGAGPRLRVHLRAAGIAIYEVPWADTLDDVRAVTRALGERLGAAPRAEEILAAMDAKLAAARAHAPTPPVRTLIYEPNGYATGGTLAGQIMSAAGLANAAPSLGPTRLGTIPVEAVIAAAPELVIFGEHPEARDARANLVLHHPALAALEGRSAMTWSPLTPLLCPGPWSVGIADFFAESARRARGLAAARAGE